MAGLFKTLTQKPEDSNGLFKQLMNQKLSTSEEQFKNVFSIPESTSPRKKEIIPTLTPSIKTDTQNLFKFDPTIKPELTQAEIRSPYSPIRPSVVLPSIGAGLSDLATGINKALLTAGQVALSPATLLSQKVSGQPLDITKNQLLGLPTFAQYKLEQEKKGIESKIPTNLSAPERVVSGVLRSTPTTLAAGLTGGTAGLGLVGATSFGQGVSTIEQTNPNASLGQKLGYGALSGLTEAATEKLPLKGLEDIIQGKTGNVLKQVLSNAGIEFIGESASQVADTFNRKITFDPQSKLDFKQVLESGITGAASAILLGGSMAGVNSAVTAIQNKDTSAQTIAQVNSDVEQATGVNIEKELQGQPSEKVLNDIKQVVESSKPTTETIKQPVQPLETQTSTNVPTQAVNQNIAPTIPIEERSFSNVSSQKVKAFQYENPQFKPFIQQRASELIGDLENTQKGEKQFAYDENGDMTVTGNARTTSEAIERIKDNITPQPTYAQIKDALQRIVNDNGQENIALAKKIELVIDDDLSEGYSTMDGYEIPPTEEYKSLKAQLAPKETIMYEDTGLNNQKDVSLTIPLEQKPGDRKTVSNTIQSAIDAGIISDKVVDLMPEEAKTYIPTTNEIQWNYAKEKVSKDAFGSFAEFMTKDKLGNEGKDTALAEALIKKFSDEGNYGAAADVASKLTLLGTEAAQAIQAISILKRIDPQGMLYYAEKQTSKANDKAKIDKANEISKEAEAISKTAEENVLDDVIVTLDESIFGERKPTTKNINEETEAEKLAKSIKNKIDSLSKSKDETDITLVDVLKKVASQKLPKSQVQKKSSMPEIIDAVSRQNKYQEVWQEARDILNEQFAGNPDLSYVNDIFDNKLRPTFSTKTLDSSIKEILSQKGLKLRDIIKSDPNSSKTIDETVYNSLVNSGFTDSQAKYLKNIINSRVKELSKGIKESELEKLFKERNVPVKKNELQKFAEYTNIGAFSNDSFKQKLYDKLGVTGITNEDSRFIVKSMKKIQSMPEGKEKDIEFAKVLQVISDKIPTDFNEKQKSIRRMMMLLNPKTQVRNTLGNVIMSTAENIAQVPSAGIDKALSLITGNRTTLLPQLTSQSKGYLEGFKDALNDYKLGIDTTKSGGGAYEVGQSKKVFNESGNVLQSFVGKGLNKTNNFLSFIMSLGDRPFYQAALNERLAELKKIKGEITQDDYLTAHEFALDRVFQNDTEISKAMSEIKGAMNRANIKGFGFGDAVLPFTKTPANVLRKGVQFTPLGVLSNLKQIGSGFDQKAFSDSIGRSMTGSTIMYLGYLLAKEGLASGEYDKNKDKEAAQNLAGETNYSLKIGDKYYSFDWAQPISIPLAVGIDFYNAGKNEKDLASAAKKGITSGANTLFNQSLLQGLSRMFGGYSPTSGILDTVLSAPSQYVPTLLGQTSKTTDKYIRRTDVPFGQIKSKIPGLRETLPKKIDVLGNEMLTNQGRTGPIKALENFVFPNTVSQKNEDKLTSELLRLSKVVNVTGFLPNIAPKSIKPYKEDAINLDVNNQNEFQKEMGKLNYKNMTEMINSQDYIDATDDEKAKMLASINDDSFEETKIKFIDMLK